MSREVIPENDYVNSFAEPLNIVYIGTKKVKGNKSQKRRSKTKEHNGRANVNGMAIN